MTQPLEVARWAAVHQLQRRACSDDPCSFGSAVADHAVGLVLNPSRSPDTYLAHNATRDARKVIAARLRNSRLRDVSLIDIERTKPLGSSSDASNNFVGVALQSESGILWKDAFDRLRLAAANRNSRAAACLDHWRDGDADHETAAALGISLAYVKKLKRLIREIACTLLPEEVRA
jgi:hypothetical protein